MTIATQRRYGTYTAAALHIVTSVNCRHPVAVVSWSRRGSRRWMTVARSTGKTASERKREPDGSSPLRPANSTLPYPAVPTTENSLACSFSCPMIQPYVVIGTLCSPSASSLLLASSASRVARPDDVHKDEAEDEDRETIKEERKEDFAREEDGRRDARLSRQGGKGREEIEKGRGRWRLQGYTRPEQGPRARASERREREREENGRRGGEGGTTQQSCIRQRCGEHLKSLKSPEALTTTAGDGGIPW
ncbi:hypothetical protein ALC57_00896 [Trachymyrmex cornetzi]|uniref:Uncharacterized protein n=1 Tax=Trachymyrmex cornetzi TaxID=471704 RepID=A0A195EN61_9HYME|nr:hypothetical protein ALC57_00896 [Trachymyrmex cornetzi]